MDWSRGSERIIADAATDPVAGRVRWKPVKSIWIGSMTLTALIAGPLTFTWDALLVFLIGCGVTLCAGHSVGMHRRLIHNSFECPLWLEYVMVYAGVLVGMAGPFGLMHQHDLRDWAQRQPNCHDYLKHGRGIWRDAWWQLHCDLELERAPRFQPEPRIADDRVYAWMERTWMWQQLPLALILFAFGGWSWVVWGVAARVATCVTGHWLIGYFAHNEGPMRWRVEGAGVQGHDVPIAALLSMGESWHNNHHAYPGSARIGLNDDQPDPGWWFVCALERLGLARNIQTPAVMPARKALVRVSNDDGGCPACRLSLRWWKARGRGPRAGFAFATRTAS
ncbi:acyl-CoA desaturase [Terricaulis sp.]|uniref:acyl-CoA desaturase n=1 Tax=Terricaulis sp. TaxID=2768686 RepID=UPI003783D1A1